MAVGPGKTQRLVHRPFGREYFGRSGNHLHIFFQQKKRNMKSFSKAVCQAVEKIPLGKTMTYKQVAEKAGYPRAWRAVGNVLNKNDNQKIPCHRVICSDNTSGGYRFGKKKKIKILRKEGVVFEK